ncbi:MAG TPA: asparagine synthase-related protein [Pyrinomonadaceae bacterium]
MSILAGIYSRDDKVPVPDSMSSALKRLVSRNAGDEVTVYEDRRCYFVKVDVGALGEPGHHTDSDNSVSLLAGEPLLSDNGARQWQSREQDLKLIHEELARGEFHALTRAQGVFCAINYQPASATLSLIADKLCIRPLYYWMDERYVVFASALRILEGLSEIPKKMNLRAVTEVVGLGYPLGSRTPYMDIQLLRAAEVVRINGQELSSFHYWRWDDIKPSAGAQEELSRELYDRFETAVARGIRNDTVTVAYLSGGLDSRCVVAALRHLKVRVHTFNFARPGTQDQIFGRDFARQIETIHEEVPKEPGDHVPDYSSMMARVWGGSKNRERYPAERPSLIWSGEGGSVALGHVHMSRKIVELMRAGQVDAAIEEYLEREQIYVSPKLFRPGVIAHLTGILNKGIREELDVINAADPARSFYLFLMLNDQRRKLSGHFENIDQHRLEFQLPFFNSAFLELIVSAPVDLCLGHKLYVKWLTYFPQAVTSVPWQAYPGHEPCPLPVAQELSYQWDSGYQMAEHKSQKRTLAQQARELLGARDFPAEILSKNRFRLAALIHSTGRRDYEYFIKAAQTYHTYWRICHGDYALPSATR